MHRSTLIIVLLLIGFFVTSCAGVGVLNSSDPKQKLRDAKFLFKNQDRPLLAEGIIREAIQIFEVEKNYHWLGNAYRDYGDFLRSDAVANHEGVYKKWGFEDKSITFNNRIEKANEKYTQAIEYYKKSETIFLNLKKYDSLTNVYFNLAWMHHRLESENQLICNYFDKTENSYLQNIEKNPDATPSFSNGFNSISDEINHYKKQFNCSTISG